MSVTGVIIPFSDEAEANEKYYTEKLQQIKDKPPVPPFEPYPPSDRRPATAGSERSALWNRPKVTVSASTNAPWFTPSPYIKPGTFAAGKGPSNISQLQAQAQTQAQRSNQSYSSSASARRGSSAEAEADAAGVGVGVSVSRAASHSSTRNPHSHSHSLNQSLAVSPVHSQAGALSCAASHAHSHARNNDQPPQHHNNGNSLNGSFSEFKPSGSARSQQRQPPPRRPNPSLDGETRAELSALMASRAALRSTNSSTVPLLPQRYDASPLNHGNKHASSNKHCNGTANASLNATKTAVTTTTASNAGSGGVMTRDDLPPQLKLGFATVPWGRPIVTQRN